MNALYAQSDMRVGKPQTLAHLIIERANTYWILFGIPEVDVRADVVEFKPAAKPELKSGPVVQAIQFGKGACKNRSRLKA